MPKNSWSFAVAPLVAPVAVTLWGHYGLPVVLFASAGGDSLEPQRLRLIESLAPLLDAGRIKVYAVDGSAMRTLLAGTASAALRVQVQQAFADWVASGLVPQVRRDCQSDALEPLACGCAFGAASAMQALLHSPQLFRGAIGLSGTYDLLPWISAAAAGDAAAAAALPLECSPRQWLSQLPEGPQLARVRQRSVTLGCATGDYEDPEATRQMAALLRARGISTQLDVWGADFGFGFSSWRQMLPKFLAGWL